MVTLAEAEKKRLAEIQKRRLSERARQKLAQQQTARSRMVREAQSKINTLRTEIDRLNTRISAGKFKGSRGRTILIDRIKGRQAEISFLDSSIKAGKLPKDLLEKSKTVRLETTRELGRQRQKAAGLTPGTAKKKITLKQPSKIKGITFTTFEKEFQKKAARGDKRAAETLKKFREAPSIDIKTEIIESIKGPGALKVKKVEIKTGKVIQKGQFKLDRAFEARLRASKKPQNLFFEGSGGKKVIDLLSPRDQEKIFRSISFKKEDVVPANVRLLFTAIDKNKNLTFLQKEENKRNIIGLKPSDPRAQGFFRTPSPFEAQQALNTIKPSDFKKGSGLLGLIGRVIAPNITSALPKIRTFNSFMENQRRKAIRGNKNAQASIIGVASLPTNFIESYSDIVIGIVLLALNPKETVIAISQLKKKDIDAAGAALGVRVQRGDPSVVTDIAAELITQRFGLGIFKGARAAQKLRPSFVRAAGETFVIKKTPFRSVKDFLTKKNNPISKIFKRDPEIVLKKQTVKTGASPLSKQARLAGETITAVNAAADQLTSWIKRKQIVRKPIPGEADFPTNIKNILKKFDEGKRLSVKQFAGVNKWLKKNVAPNITLLERSLYADPASGLRISRLGIQKVRTASLKDILRGNFKLIDRTKPQVLIFQNVKVAKFPKSLKDVESKLKAGKKLTENETNRLIAWQVKTGSGKFKPVGSTIYKGGIELEVTLAPGEFIKRIKQVGFTFIEGKKVTFVTAEVWKPPKTFLDEIKKAKAGKLDSKELSKLEKDLSKKLGRKVKVETPKSKKAKVRRARPDVPVLRIKGNLLRVIRPRAPKPRAKPVRAPTPRAKPVRAPTPRAKPVRAPTPRAKPVRAPTPRAKPVRAPTPRAKPVRAPTPRAKPVRAPTPRAKPVRAPTPRAPEKPIKRPKLSFDSKQLDNRILEFEGIFRERKNRNLPASKNNPVITKKIKLKTTRNRALKKVADLTDRRTARSLELRVVGITNKKVKDIKAPAVIKKFNTKSSKGTPVLKLVEKSKFAIDSKGEKRELKRAKALKPSQKKKSKKQVKVSVKKKKSSVNPSKVSKKRK